MTSPCTGPNCQGHPHSPECRAEYARSLQSTRSEAMESKWQPIETAPKDGSRIMLGSRYGVWMAEYRPVAQSGYVFDNPWASMMLNCDHIPLEQRYKAATHWLPLPEPPGDEHE